MLRARLTFGILLQAGCTDDAPPESEMDTEGVAESGTMSTSGPSTSDPTMGPSPESWVTMTMTMTSADTESETTPTTTGPTGCDDPGDCGGSTPFCVNDLCVDCGAAEGDASCAGLDPNLPLCFDGECVACTEADVGSCAGTTPICDLSNNTCVGCTFHEQCQELVLPACHIAEGSCITESTSVDGGIAGTIQAAIDEVDPGVPHAIMLTDGGQLHTINIGGGKIIALVSDNNEFRSIRGSNASPVVTATGGSTIAYLHRVIVEDGDGVGVSAEMSATLYADNTQVLQNNDGGIALNGSTGNLRNCMISQSAAESPGISVVDSTLGAAYITIGTNTFMNNPALSCNGGAEVTVRNSIIVTQGGSLGSEIACAGDVNVLRDRGRARWHGECGRGRTQRGLVRRLQ